MIGDGNAEGKKRYYRYGLAQMKAITATEREDLSKHISQVFDFSFTWVCLLSYLLVFLEWMARPRHVFETSSAIFFVPAKSPSELITCDLMARKD